MHNLKHTAHNPSHANQNNKKILIMDDETSICNFLSRALTSKGFQVTSFYLPTEGIESIKNKGTDIVLSDLKMPMIDGIKTLNLIKQIDPSIEVLIMTGYATIETAVTALKLGAHDYIMKPFNLDDLFLKISSAFYKQKQNRDQGTLYSFYNTAHLTHLVHQELPSRFIIEKALHLIFYLTGARAGYFIYPPDFEYSENIKKQEIIDAEHYITETHHSLYARKEYTIQEIPLPWRNDKSLILCIKIGSNYLSRLHILLPSESKITRDLEHAIYIISAFIKLLFENKYNKC